MNATASGETVRPHGGDDEVCQRARHHALDLIERWQAAPDEASERAAIRGIETYARHFGQPGPVNPGDPSPPPVIFGDESLYVVVDDHATRHRPTSEPRTWQRIVVIPWPYLDLVP